MAIMCLEESLKVFDSEIYVYHEIVHNKYVVDSFADRGVTFIDDLSAVPVGSVLLFSAHGVSPAVREIAQTRNLHTIDATCPLVTKVHLEAIKYAKQGYHIILIGHEGHDEVIGTMGEAPESITLVETAEDVQHLSFEGDAKIAYLTQTTLSVQEAERVIAALKQKYPQIASPPKDDICYATTNRQEAVSQLAPEADVVIVLGSQNSSNSRRLKELARSIGKPAYLVDGVDELKQEWFHQAETVLITAGASAPEVVVQECVQYFQRHFQGEVEEMTVRSEDVVFPLPKSLRNQIEAE